MEIITVVVGPIEVNCYIVHDSVSHKAFIIDPGAEPEKIEKVLQEHDLTPEFIINTHGHIDHIGANTVRSLPIYIHEADASFLTDPAKNLSSLMGYDFRSPEASHIVKDGDVIPFGDLSMHVLHTPGHTPGCMCIHVGDHLFSGDTLFRGSIGRTDFPYSDSRQILDSIDEKIVPLADATKIYPGHGPSSDLGYEKKNNFFIASRMV